MSSKIDVKIGIEKSRFQGGPVRFEFDELVARSGLKGGGNGQSGRSSGRKKERKKGRKEERK